MKIYILDHKDLTFLMVKIRQNKQKLKLKNSDK